MKPKIAIIGRTNVGKSTLFNRLTRSHDAIVSNFLYLTRDRHYGEGIIENKKYILIDTGGLSEEKFSKNDIILREVIIQAKKAIEEANMIMFVVDWKSGITYQDKIIANYLRKTGQLISVVINKAEGINANNIDISDFYDIWQGDLYLISAKHGDGVTEMMKKIISKIYLNYSNKKQEKENINKDIIISIIGRPNVGKSTLVNTLLGKEQVITLNSPGTTRDSIYIKFNRKFKQYILIDTAGLRKKGKASEIIEKFSMTKTIQSIYDSNVAIILIDATENISDQDIHIANFALKSGKSIVIGINKWDKINENQQKNLKYILKKKLHFLNFIKYNFISAKKKIGIDKLMNAVNSAYKSSFTKLSASKLTQTLINSVKLHPPRKLNSIRPKLRYAHQGGQNPPLIIIHGNSLNVINDTYKRYLEHQFRKTFHLQGTPLKIIFKTSINPYIDKQKIVK